MVPVGDAAALRSALAAAQPGDVIALADGTYAGPFTLDASASGTAQNPIVIRGASMDGTILDGMGCTGCNVVEIYGSFVHLERLSIRNASRALRFQGPGTQGNVVRRVHVHDVTLGVGSQPNQLDFYLCDNVLEGRLVGPTLGWPLVYTSDGGAHANDDGIHVEGFGHVVCHNRLSGFGDAMKTEQDGARAVDFYGNEVLWSYDNGLELDGSEGNTRAFRNRFTNTYATLSFQPIFGGPAYAIRNVVVNVANEQLKFHALGGTPPEEPSGMLVYHNTFVSPAHALSLQTSATSHHFALGNNLFYGPAAPDAMRTVDWTGGIDDGRFDWNGYFPDARFSYAIGGTYQTFANFAAVQAAGLEMHGRVVGAQAFANGLGPPATYQTMLTPQDVTLAPGSDAIDHGTVLPNINDSFTGAAPDLGAFEVGCPLPIYGPRPEGTDESNEPVGCTPGGGGSGGSGGSGGGGGAAGAGGSGGSGGNAGSGGGGSGGSGGNRAGGEAAGGCGCTLGRAGSGGDARALLVVLGALTLWAARRRTRRGWAARRPVGPSRNRSFPGCIFRARPRAPR